MNPEYNSLVTQSLIALYDRPFLVLKGSTVCECNGNIAHIFHSEGAPTSLTDLRPSFKAAVETLLSQEKSLTEGQPISIELLTTKADFLPGHSYELTAICPSKDLNEGWLLTVRLLSLSNDMAVLEERLNLITRATLDGMYDWHRLHNEIWANDWFYRLFGLERPPIADASFATIWADRIHPDDKERIFSALRQAQERFQSDLTTEYRVLRPDGKVVYVVDRSHIVYSDELEAIRIVGSVTDITHLRQTEERLSQSEDRFRKSFSSAPMPIAIIQFDTGLFLEANHSFLNTTGYNWEQIHEKTPRQAGLFREYREYERLMSTLARNKSVKGLEMVLATPSGQDLYVLVSAELINLGEQLSVLLMFQDITERKHAESVLVEREKQLRASEHKFSQAFANAPFPFVISDLETGLILEANEFALQLSGFTRAELVGRNVMDFNTWPSEEERAAFTHRLHHEGQIRDYDMHLVSKSGNLIEAVAFFELIELENKPCILAMFQNMTAERRAAAELKKSEQEFRAIYENAPIPIAMIRFDGRIIKANQALCKVFGYQHDEIIGMRFTDISHPDDAAVGQDSVKALLAGEIQHFSIEKRYMAKNGQVIHAILQVSVLEGADESEGYLLAQVVDITSLKEAQRKVRESEQLLHSISQNLNEGIYRSSKDKGLIYVNKALARLFGFQSPEELYSQESVSLYVDPAMRDYLTDRLMEDGGFKNQEVEFRRKDGTTFWGLNSALTVTDDQGNVFFDGAIVDITIRKQAEELLRQKNRELEKINQELDRFVYSASHDLKAPLSSIMGLIHIAKMDAKDPRMLEYFQMIGNAAEKLNAFIKDLIAYSRNARAEVVASKVLFSEIVQDTVDKLRFMQKADRVDLQIHIAVEGEFYSDANRLKAVFSNLIANAIKYHDTDKEHPFVKVDITGNARNVRVVIADNGSGIDPEHHARLFEMFYRASSDTEGSGLGLYITKEAIEKVGGSISMESVPKEGTTFTIQLPGLTPA